MAEQAQSTGTLTARPSAELVKGLGLFDSTMIVVGSMIGSGIFIVSADIAHQVQSPGLLLVVWLASGVMTLIGALSYGELAAAMPQAGGQYVYLRESLGEIWGFLYGWTMLLVIQTATIAAVAIAFAKFTGVLAPWFSPAHWIWKIGTFGPWRLWFGELGPYNVGLNRQNLLAILSIILLTWINTRGLRLGKIVQNIFTVAKTGALAVLVLLGFWFTTAIARSTNFTHFWRNAAWHTMHAYPPDNPTWMIGNHHPGGRRDGRLAFRDGRLEQRHLHSCRSEKSRPQFAACHWLWARACCAALHTRKRRLSARAADLRRPARQTPLARGIEFAADGRVATAVTQVIFGPAGAILMALAILISTFGCNNGLILSGARIYYAMAKDGLFFRSVGTVNRYHVPGVALVVQCVWASVLCLSGTYSQLLDFLIFAELIFYILTLLGLFVLRSRRPEIERPYRAFGYPILPLLYIAMAVFLEIQLLRYKPQYTWPGLIIVLLGLPVYGLWTWLGRWPAES